MVGAAVANAFAERWIGTLRRELLDRTIIWNQRPLQHACLNSGRQHRRGWLDQRPPTPTQPPNANGQQQLRIIRATRCDGLINEYQRAA